MGLNIVFSPMAQLFDIPSLFPKTAFRSSGRCFRGGEALPLRPPQPAVLETARLGRSSTVSWKTSGRA